MQAQRLRATTMGGIVWMLAGTGGHGLFQVFVLAILARLVTPTEFGVLGASLVVVNLSTIFMESGIGPALVQRLEIDDRMVRAGLTFQMLAGTGLWLLFTATSGFVAGLFNIAEMAELLPAITLVFVIRSLTLGDFLLLRKLRFKQLALIELSSYILGYGCLAVFLALRGYGVWALIAGHLGQSALRTVALWVWSPHAFLPLIDRQALRGLLSYGGGLTIGAYANYAARQGDNFVVGRWLGAASLGLYSRAYYLMLMPATLFGQVLDQVLFPAMAKVQDQREKLRVVYLQGVALIGTGTLLISVLAGLLSTEVVLVLLGPTWLPLKAAFDVLVFGMLFRTGYKLSDVLTKATGAVYRRAWRQVLYAAMVLVGAFIGQRWGITGVAVGVTVALASNYLLMAQLSLGLVGGKWSSFLLAHVPAVVMAGLMALAVWPVAVALRSLDWGPLVVLVGSLIVAALIVLVLVRLAPRVPAAHQSTATITGIVGALGGSFPHRTIRWVLGPRYTESGPVIEVEALPVPTSGDAEQEPSPPRA